MGLFSKVLTEKFEFFFSGSKFVILFYHNCPGKFLKKKDSLIPYVTDNFQITYLSRDNLKKLFLVNFEIIVYSFDLEASVLISILNMRSTF